MKLAIIAFTRRGGLLGRTLKEGLAHPCTLHVPPRLAEELGAEEYSTLNQWTKTCWQECDGLIFVGATGIAVRGIAPFVADKFTDPAVVTVDEMGGYAIPLLSGHVGGANALAQQVATLTGGVATLSTATDLHGLFAVDVWAKEEGLTLTDRTLAKEISATLLAGGQVGFASDFCHPCPPGLTTQKAELGIWVTARGGEPPFQRTLQLTHKGYTLGIGCRRGTSAQTIARVVAEGLGTYPLAGVTQVATIDIKGDEVGLLAFCKDKHLPLCTHTAQELAQVKGDFTPSAFVAETVGVDNVCERAAAFGGGQLIVKKYPKCGVTVALAWNP